jgi:hypothetical protein
VLGGALNLFGQNKSMEQMKKVYGDIKNLPGMQGPANLMGDFGSSVDGQQQFNPLTQSLMSLYGSTAPGMMTGQMANPLLQMGLGGMGNALSAANAANMYNVGPMNAGSLGISQGLFDQGMANLQRAGDVGGLRDEQLAMMREAYAPTAQKMRVDLSEDLYNMGLLGRKTDTQGSYGMQRAMLDAQNQADLGFQNAAFDRGMQQANYLQNLGMGQLGSGLGAESQAFRQALGSNQAKQNALNANLGLFSNLYGMGGELFGQNYGLGLEGMNTMNMFNRLGLDMAAMPYQLQAELLRGSGDHANAMANLGSQMASQKGGFFSSLGGMFGGGG